MSAPVLRVCLALACVVVLVPCALDAATIFVRKSGSNTNDGTSPLRAVQTITYAAEIASPGDRVVVGPGVYNEGRIGPSAYGRITFTADRSGALVGEVPGYVVIDAAGHLTGFELNGKPAVTIDGFVIYGATDDGIYVKSGSDHVIIANNIISANGGHGIIVHDTRAVLIFNNLSYANRQNGILVTGSFPGPGSPSVRIFNNSVYRNGSASTSGRGIFFSGDEGAPSPNGTVLNNITAENRTAGVQINEESRPGYLTAGNVVADGFNDRTPFDATDVRADPRFVDPDGPDNLLGGANFSDDNFRLRRESGSASPAIDAGAHLVHYFGLNRASTRADDHYDRSWVDAGYHYGNYQIAPPRRSLRPRFRHLYVNAAGGSDQATGDRAQAALKTLTQAMTRAEPGTHIIVMPGTYDAMNLTTAIGGQGRREVIVEARGEVVLDARGVANGFTLGSDRRLTLTGVKVRGAIAGAIEATERSAVRLYGVELSGNNGQGLRLFDGATAEVIASSIRANSKSGILVCNPDELVCGARVSLSGSVVTLNGQEGIRASRASVQVFESDITSNTSEGIALTAAEFFIFRGGVVANNGMDGVRILGGQDVSVVSARVFSNNGDGVSIEDADGALLFNNLIYANAGTGILLGGIERGTTAAQVLNNTVYANEERGLQIGSGGVIPSSVIARRNVFQGNLSLGVLVTDSSFPSYSGDFNLSADPYGDKTPVGLNDRLAEASFEDPAGPDGILGGDGYQDDDFHLAQGFSSARSLAVDGGDVSVFTAGLLGYTTRRDAIPDVGLVDLGFHYRP